MLNRIRPALYVVDHHVSPALVAEWAQWMQAAGMSRRTIEDRVQLLARLSRATGVEANLTGWQALAAFLGSAPSAGTRYTYFTHLRAWYRWLVLLDYRVDDPTMKLRAPRAPKRKPRPVSLAQLGRILSTPAHRRTRVMVLLAAYQGLRVSEIGAFRAESFHDSGRRIILRGKGGREDELPVHPLVAAAAQVMPARGLWFPSHVRTGRPTLGNSVSAILGNLMRRAGIFSPYTPHSLRHFYGTQVLRAAGGNLIVARDLMRHASVATTEGYTSVDDELRRAAIAALPTPPSVAA